MINNILWIPIAVILCYSPVLCYLDIKYRDVFSHAIWLPAVAINIPPTILLFYLGVYQWWTVMLSIIGVAFWYLTMRLNIINGADFVYLSLIFIFVVVNPITGHLMFLPYMIFLIVWMAASMWYIFLKNKKDAAINKTKISIFKALTIKGGLPMMIPISLAFLSAVVFG